jgi:hypothetical protein
MQAGRQGEEASRAGAGEPEDPAPEQQPREQARIFVKAVGGSLPRWEEELAERAPDPRPRRRLKVLVVAAGALAAAVTGLVLAPSLGTPAPGQNGVPTAAAPTTTPPGSSSSESPPSTTSPGNGLLPPPPPTGTSSSGTRPSDATTTAPTSTGSTLAELPGRYEGVQEKRVVELVPQERYNWVDIEYWRHDTAAPGEVQMDGTGVHTVVGAGLAVIEDTPLANRDRCAKVTSWRDRVDFGELHAGSQLCGRSRAGRYASLEVRTLPSSPSSNGRFIFFGITWN